jgi:hypothetical protein
MHSERLGDDGETREATAARAKRWVSFNGVHEDQDEKDEARFDAFLSLLDKDRDTVTGVFVEGCCFTLTHLMRLFQALEGLPTLSRLELGCSSVWKAHPASTAVEGDRKAAQRTMIPLLQHLIATRPYIQLGLSYTSMEDDDLRALIDWSTATDAPAFRRNLPHAHIDLSCNDLSDDAVDQAEHALSAVSVLTVLSGNMLRREVTDEDRVRLCEEAHTYSINRDNVFNLTDP